MADDPGLTRELILATSASESIGRAAQGRLKNGVPVAEHEALKVLNGSRETHFGTAELVALVEHASAEVANAFPQSKLYVGDLSRPGGGHLSSHRSHRSGRDVDLGFYFTDEHGVQVESRHFVRFDRQGVGVTGWSHQEVHFDARRNWALLASMMRFEGARLQYVFVSPALQAMLLEEARRVGEPEEFIQEAERLMSHFAGGHDNHFHVRIHCPPSDEQCLNDEPRRRRRSSARRPPQRGHARH